MEPIAPAFDLDNIHLEHLRINAQQDELGMILPGGIDG